MAPALSSTIKTDNCEMSALMNWRSLWILLLVSGFWISGSSSAAQEDAGKISTATFAGGCFWCMEPPFDKVDGVLDTTAGYTGGQTKDPTYKDVSAGGTGHAEVVRVRYDPEKVSYEALLDIFWRNVDPLTANRQFCDYGSQYRTAIFYHDAQQKQLAERSKLALEQSGRFTQPIVTEIVPATTFYVAEAYHQDYYQKNSLLYKLYRYNCGRDRRLEEVWGS